MSRSKQYLPRAGVITLPEIVGFIGKVSDLLGSPPTIEHRVVAYPDKENRWVVYASSVYVGYPIRPNSHQFVKLGPLVLVSNHSRPKDVDTPEKFRAFLTSWPTVAGGGELLQPTFGNDVHINRMGSDQGYAGYPCWRAVLYYATQTADFPPPDGPFYDEMSGHFAERAAEAAVVWLDDEHFRDGSMPNSALRLVVADPRAVITRFAREPESVRITVFGTRPEMKLNIVVQMFGYAGVIESPISSAVVAVGQERAATIPVSAPFQRFRALLFGPDGEVYDEVNETIARPSARGYELFGISSSSQDVDLTQALTAGESDTVECKEWMPTDTTAGKANELLKSVCAFANGRGGSIYIGVSKHLEIKGTDRQLRTWHEKEGRSGHSVSDLRAEYAKAVRSRIADGISPSVSIEIEWIEYAGGEHICRVKIHGSGQLIHWVIATNDIYVRRGANSRKARPEELIGNVLDKRTVAELGLF
jgi:hypothetical protein